MSNTPNEKAANEWENKELGVLWKRKSKSKGETFLTGKINLKSLGFDKDVSLVIFSNKQKKQDNHPDLRIYVSEPKANGGATDSKAAAAAPAPAENNDDVI